MSEDQGQLSWAKKLMTLGVGTFFLSDEGLKSLVSEFKIPTELVSNILDGAKNVRKEFIHSFSQEILSKLSEKVDPTVVLQEFLRKNDVTFEIKVKVKEKSPDSGGDIKTS